MASCLFCRECVAGLLCLRHGEHQVREAYADDYNLYGEVYSPGVISCQILNSDPGEQA